MTEIRLLVAGGRDYQFTLDDIHYLDSLLQWGCVELVQGGATGADQCAREWAAQHGIPIKTFKPAWREHGPKAGPMRNRDMAQYMARMDREQPWTKSTVVLFPGGKGTASMKAEATAAGLSIVERNTL